LSIEDRAERTETEQTLEQAYITTLYDRLDELRQRASDRRAAVMRQVGGTHAARTERDVLAVMYGQQLAQLDAAENGLCFGRLEFNDGTKSYIGRVGMFEIQHLVVETDELAALGAKMPAHPHFSW